MKKILRLNETLPFDGLKLIQVNDGFVVVDLKAEIKEFDYDVEWCDIDKKWTTPTKVVNESWDRVSKANYCRKLGTNFKCIFATPNLNLEGVPEIEEKKNYLLINYVFMIEDILIFL